MRYQSDHGNYVCSHVGVAMSGGDRTDSSTRVPATRRVWASVVLSCLILNSPAA
jgi:hydrogenase maturation factor